MSTAEATAEFLTPPQVGELLGVGHDKILTFIRSGELSAVNLAARCGGKRPRWRISRDDLDDFLRRRRSTPPRPEPTRRLRKKPAEVTEFF